MQKSKKKCRDLKTLKTFLNKIKVLCGYYSCKKIENCKKENKKIKFQEIYFVWKFDRTNRCGPARNLPTFLFIEKSREKKTRAETPILHLPKRLKKGVFPEDRIPLKGKG